MTSGVLRANDDRAAGRREVRCFASALCTEPRGNGYESAWGGLWTVHVQVLAASGLRIGSGRVESSLELGSARMGRVQTAVEGRATARGLYYRLPITDYRREVGGDDMHMVQCCH